MADAATASSYMTDTSDDKPQIHDGGKPAEVGEHEPSEYVNADVVSLGGQEDVNDGDKDPEKASSGPKPAAPGGIPDPSSYPDGGLKAWLAVFGGFCCLFVSFGWINAIGIFQEFYQTNLLSEYSPSTVAWIVSLETFCMFFGGPVIGLLYDNYGPRYLLLCGSFLHVFGLMMTSISTQYYQILLAQGVCSPIGASIIFYCAMSSIVTWFYRRRALALGVMASGSSLGGVIFPILIQRMIPEVGFPWAMRTAAFLILFLLILANLFVRARIPPHPRPFHPKYFIAPFSELNFTILAVAVFLIFFGLFIPFNFVSLQALTVGMDANLASYLIPILNTASIFGRTLPGYAADYLGRFNVTITMCALCGILCLALWLPSASNAPVIIFAIFYGFGSGAFVSMVPALVAAVSADIRQIGVRTGAMFAVVSIGALTGNPIAGALLNEDDGRYTKLQIFCGVLILVGSAILAIPRLLLSKGKIAVLL